METRKIKITLATAERWVNGNDAELKELALTTFPELGKKALPKSFSEIHTDGWFVNDDEDIKSHNNCQDLKGFRNIFATREQAEASIALAQLSQLMKVYNGDWVADWTDETDKFVIEFYDNNIYATNYMNTQKFLAFKDAETRDLFLENFRDLILTAKPLL